MTMANTVVTAAPAKINLYLHVTGKRADGYHLLDSLIAFAGVGDTIEASAADDLALACDGPFGAALGAEDQERLRAINKEVSSLSVQFGNNLLSPGATPHDNMQFLVFCAAVLKGVDKWQGLLRASIASAGNDHRLGANEAQIGRAHV